eukprot:10570054-Alexandrium_andersonii.AAC.1
MVQPWGALPEEELARLAAQPAECDLRQVREAAAGKPTPRHLLRHQYQRGRLHLALEVVGSQWEVVRRPFLRRA